MNRFFSDATNSIRQVSAITAATLLLTGGLVHAQDTQSLSRPEFHMAPQGYGPGDYWHPYHSSTLQEGLLRGYSDYLRSRGQGELFHYEALRSREAAVEHALDNSVRRLETRQTRELMGLWHRETLRRMERDRRSSAAVQPTEAGPRDEAAEGERQAANKLVLARNLLDAGYLAGAQRHLQAIVDDFAGTTAAREAEQLLARR